jgi:DNA topoisomerase III
VTMRYAPIEEHARLWSRADAEALRERIQDAQGTVRVMREAKRQSPPKPYALSDLQGDANTRFGYSAQTTLDLAQSLYEKHKAITYPRSDCNYLPEEMARDVPRIVGFLIQTQVIPSHPELAKPLVRKTHFDNTQLSEHHAIVPTAIRAPVEQMVEAERNLFELIARRFAQILLPDYEYEATTMTLLVKEVPLEARGRVPLKMGWRDLDREPTEEEQADGDMRALPPIRDGSAGRVSSVEVMQKATQAPKRYTERTLIMDMKQVHRRVAEARLKALLKANSGLGTEATRAHMIESLKKREFIVLGGSRKREITSTLSGRRLIDLLPEVLTMPGLTAAWEDLLESVAQGTRTREDALEALTLHMRKQLNAVIHSKPTPSTPSSPNSASPAPILKQPDAGRSNPANTTHNAAPPLSDCEVPLCPSCGRPMKWRLNSRTQYGFWGCSAYPRCMATVDPARQARPTDEPPPNCPSCSKPMRLKQGSRGAFFGCTGWPKCRSTLDASTGGRPSTGHSGGGLAPSPRPRF